MQELEKQLREDLSKIGLNVEFNLLLKPYSKTYFGRYDVKSSTIILYVNETPKGKRYPYLDLLLTVVHEAIHCLQWHDPKFKRVRGVMHDVEFKKLYEKYSSRAKARVLFKEARRSYDSFCQKPYKKGDDLYRITC